MPLIFVLVSAGRGIVPNCFCSTNQVNPKVNSFDSFDETNNEYSRLFFKKRKWIEKRIFLIDGASK